MQKQIQKTLHELKENLQRNHNGLRCLTVNDFLKQQTSKIEKECFLVELPRFDDCIDLWSISDIVSKLRIYIDENNEIDLRLKAALSHLQNKWFYHCKFIRKFLFRGMCGKKSYKKDIVKVEVNESIHKKVKIENIKKENVSDEEDLSDDAIFECLKNDCEFYTNVSDFKRVFSACRY